MLKEFQLTNFKTFSGEASIPIKPITLIFGANSSGKSSVFHPLLMLKQTLEEEGPNIPLLLKGSLVDIGSFKDFIYGHQLNRSFSIKMTVHPHTIRYGLFYPFYEEIGKNLDLHPNIELLDKSIDNESVSMSVSFSWNKRFSTMFISYVDLYFGDNPLPVATYDNSFGSGDFRFAGNFNHPFWKNYWNIFDSQNSDQIEKIIKNYVEGPEPKISEMLSKFGKEVIDIIEGEEKFSEYTALVSKGEVESNWLNIAVHDSIGRDDTNREIKSDLTNLKGIEKAIEAYKILHEHTTLSIRNFLPVYLNDTLIETFAGQKANWIDSRNVSLFFITTGNLIKNFLENIIYIAPLREPPERYYIYGGARFAHVGFSGKRMPDILFNDQELLSKVNDELKRFGSDYELKVSRLTSDEIGISDVFTVQLKCRAIHPFLSQSNAISCNLSSV